MKGLLYFVFFSLGIVSCQSNKGAVVIPTYSNSAIYIVTNAGEPYLDSPFLASPLVHGVMINDSNDSLDVMVVSKYCNEQRMEIIPFGSFQIVEKEEVKQIVLAFPRSNEFKVYEDMSFQDFVILNNAAKVLIDQYFSNYQGQGKTRVINWQDESSAKALVTSFLEVKEDAQ